MKTFGSASKIGLLMTRQWARASEPGRWARHMIIRCHFGLVAALACLSLSGCIMLPVPSFTHKVVSGRELKPEDLVFIELGTTAHDEVSRRFGAPWAEYEDIRVQVYYWETLAGHLVIVPLWGVFGGGAAIADNPDQITKLHYLFVKFGPEDQVQQYEIIGHPKNVAVRDLAEKWAQDLAPSRGRRSGRGMRQTARSQRMAS